MEYRHTEPVWARHQNLVARDYTAALSSVDDIACSQTPPCQT